MTLNLIPGKPSPMTSEAETLSIIRSLAGNKDHAPEPVRPRRVATRPARPIQQRAKAQTFEPLAAPDEDAKAKPVAREKRRFQWPLRRQHYIMVALIVSAVLFPRLTLFALVTVVTLLLLSIYIAGGEQIFRGIVLALHDLAETDPRRAVRLRAKIDRFITGWDSVLDRFPAGTVDRLYMPDFQAISYDEARNEARLKERLERLREGC